MKKLKSIFLLLSLLVGLGNTVRAQDAKAEAILSELSEKMSKYESVSASFSMRMVDKQAAIDETMNGKVQVQGEKYRLSVGDVLVISDGKNIWTYSQKTNEVMIDLAEDTYEEEGIKPADLFRIWETGLFKYTHGGTELIGGKTCDVIKLHPQDPSDKEFHTIMVYIDTDALEMKRAVIKGKQGTDTTYELTSFSTDFIKSESFDFDSGKYPGVEEIDNR